ncbi:hypothetical protein ACN47E_002826 [Coniothyrium glycines]
MSPASKRGDLPVFTASGAIPFAPTIESALRAPNTDTMSGGTYAQQGLPALVKGEENTRDIWEIPETPAR